MSNPDRWSDLRPRLISAAVMIVVAVVAIWMGGAIFTASVILLSAVMIWELARMTAPGSGSMPIILALVAGLSMAATLLVPPVIALALLFVPAICLYLTPRSDKLLTAGWGAAAMLAGYGLILLRIAEGIPAILWLVLVVVASDVMGYFAGRILGGAKFWPAISPKKTWSGTIAGWIGAALIGLGFVAAGYGGLGLIVLSPLVAFAGQMGDIAESWVKRRAGVKDSSNLIPGHGGFLDRFDAMTGALVLVMLLSLIFQLPLPSTAGG